MTFEAYQLNKRKIIKQLKYLGGLFSLYCIGLLIYRFSLSNLVIIMLATVLIFFIPGLSFFYMRKENKAKKNELNMEDHSLLYCYKNKRLKGKLFNTHEIMILPYMVLVWIFIFDLNFVGFFMFIHLLLMVIMGALLLGILRKLYEYPLIFHEKGIILNQKNYGYNAIKKYQWIKMRSGNMILELQLLDFFTSFVFDEKTALEINGHLKNID